MSHEEVSVRSRPDVDVHLERSRQRSARTADISVGRSTSRSAKLWVRHDYRRDKSVSYREAKMLYVVNCVAQTYTMITYAAYAPNGEVESWNNPDRTTQFVIPGTIMDIAVSLLCADPAGINMRHAV